jgi:flagellar protein FliS
MRDAVLNAAAMQQAQQRMLAQYQRVQAETSSPGQLVVMMYEGCVRFIVRARVAFEAQDFETARISLLRSQDIIAELIGSLNLEAGDVATNLLRLYEYMHRRLVTANIRRDDAAAAEVEGLLRSLVPAWQEAVRQHAQGQRGGRPTDPGGSLLTSTINAGG